MLLGFQSYLYSYNVQSKETESRQVWDGNSGQGGAENHLSDEMPPRSCTIHAFFQRYVRGSTPWDLTPEPIVWTTLWKRIWVLALAFTSFVILGRLLNFSKSQFSLPFRWAKFLPPFHAPPLTPTPYIFSQNSWVACPFIRDDSHRAGVQEQPGHDVNVVSDLTSCRWQGALSPYSAERPPVIIMTTGLS